MEFVHGGGDPANGPAGVEVADPLVRCRKHCAGLIKGFSRCNDRLKFDGAVVRLQQPRIQRRCGRGQRDVNADPKQGQ